MMNSADAGWSLSEVAAQQIRLFRKRQGLSREQLAERCQALGAPSTGPRSLSAATIANIETGRPNSDGQRRRDVTVDEVVLFARALRQPPALLLFPVGAGADSVEALPGHRVDAWTAARWFVGDGEAEAYDPDGVLTGDLDEWRAATAPLHLSREHDRLKAEYLGTLIETQFTEDDPDSHARLQRDAGLFLRDLRSVRGEMRRHGMTPPALGDDLRHVDERRHVYLTPEQAAAHEAEHPGDLNPVDYRSRT